MANNDEKFNNVSDINYSTPVEGGYGFTLGTVIRAINKIIRTFINKFQETDNKILDTKFEFSREMQGMKGTTDTFPSSDIELSRSNVQKTVKLNIPTSRKYNFGWIVLLDSSGKQLTEIPLPWSNGSSNVVQQGKSTGAYSQISDVHSLHPLNANAKLTAKSNNSNIEITINLRINDYIQSANIPANSLKIKYELY